MRVIEDMGGRKRLKRRIRALGESIGVMSDIQDMGKQYKGIKGFRTMFGSFGGLTVI